MHSEGMFYNCNLNIKEQQLCNFVVASILDNAVFL